MTESGFIIPQDIPSPSWIKRGFDAAPNQYGIKPGRLWDGVDQSNANDARRTTVVLQYPCGGPYSLI